MAIGCPSCGCLNHAVVDSRPRRRAGLWRRRECEKCGKRFTTIEKVLPGGPRPKITRQMETNAKRMRRNNVTYKNIGQALNVATATAWKLANGCYF